MNGIGVPELTIVVVLAALWLLPLAAGIWALMTLHRLKVGQDTVRARLESIERRLESAAGAGGPAR